MPMKYALLTTKRQAAVCADLNHESNKEEPSYFNPNLKTFITLQQALHNYNCMVNEQPANQTFSRDLHPLLSSLLIFIVIVIITMIL